MKSIKIDGKEYVEHTNMEGVVFFVNFDYVENYNEEDEKARYAVMLRFKKKEHLTWSWVTLDNSFKNKNDLINYLLLNTVTPDTMYVVTMKTLLA